MSLPRISWHIGDYLKDTGHLRAVGHGAYFMLCLHYYAKGSLPDDDKQLAVIARLNDKEWREHKAILQAFFYDGWKHKRIDKEIKEANAKYEARAAAGKRGGEAKANGKQNPSNATSLLDNERSKDEASLNLKPCSEPNGSAAKIDLEKQLFERGRAVLGQNAGGLIAKLLKAKGLELARAAIETASTKHEPREYIGRILAGAGVAISEQSDQEILRSVVL